jgi:hypothetical protein
MALRLRYCRSVGAAALLVAQAIPRWLHAQTSEETSKGVCRQSYESAQLRRREEELLAARDDLRICGAEACPALTRMDCVRWLAEVEAAIPSVVLEAHTSSGPVFDVAVTIDGVTRPGALDGRPMELNPGVHSFDFERPGSPLIKQKVVLGEGQKNRLVLADWSSPSLGTLHLPGRLERPIPASAYVAAGLSALGFVGFAIAGTWGNSLKSDLERSDCSPFCSREQTDALRTRFLIADIGLAIGIAQLATTAIIFLTRPERQL